MTTSHATDQVPTHPLPGDTTDHMSAALARNWWLIALRGVLGIIFGVIAFAYPAATMLGIVLVFCVYLLIDGVLAIAAAVRAARHHERWGLLLLEGIVDIAVAVIAFLFPGGAVLAFVLFVAAWAIVTGVLMLGAAFRLRIDHGRWWLVLGGIASIIYGGLLIAAPLLGAVVLTWWLGAYAIVFGVFLLIAAFQLRARREEQPPRSAAPSAA